MSCLTGLFGRFNAVTADFAPRPRAASAAAMVVALETALFGLAAVLYVVLGIAGDDAGAASFALAGMAALACAALVALTRGLWHGRRWAVSPAITWQVLQGFVGAYFLTASQPLVGTVALVSAAVALVALVLVARAGDVTR